MKTDLHFQVTDCDKVIAEIAEHRKEQQRSIMTTPFEEISTRVFHLGDDSHARRNAVRRLRRFIRSDPELYERLLAAGYNARLTYLTYRQLSILIEYL